MQRTCKERAGTTVIARSAALLVPVLLAAGLAAGACAPAGGGARSAGQEAEAEPIERVLERVTDGWMKIPGVVGTGLGLCEGVPCIKVFVTRPPEELDLPIPDEVDGHPVRFERTGPFRARDTIPEGS